MRKKPELLAPAGNFEKLKYAIHYGADAVYCAGKHFGLRAKADNFTQEELEEAVKYTHERGKRLYVTLNIIPHNEDLEGLSEYAKALEQMGVDAVLIADPGVFDLVGEAAPTLKRSMSTQTNNTNYASANFWYRQGARRIVLARELGIKAIKEIVEKTPEDLEIETFVHGAMCISYSGRCLLSHYMTGRDGNRGDCAQPCRWKYHLKEETRPDETFHIEEDEQGTFILNSKDLCLINHIPELLDTGISSMKIEGRMKSLFYVSTVVSVYRQAIDYYYDHPEETLVDPKYFEELKKVSHRNYTTGFYTGMTNADSQNYGTSSYTRHYSFAGLVLDYNEATQMATIQQRNKIECGDEVEFLSPEGFFKQKIEQLYDTDGQIIESTPHPKMIYTFKTEKPVKKMDLVRKWID